MSVSSLCSHRGFRKLAGSFAIALAAVGLAGTDSASAYYIGPSYLKVPGVSGGVKLAPYQDWIRAEANYWTAKPYLREIRGITGTYNGLKFTGTRAPQKGPSMVAISVDKN